MLSLVLSQSYQAHHGPQFERLGLLLLGDLDGFLETFFRFALGVGGQESGISFYCWKQDSAECLRFYGTALCFCACAKFHTTKERSY
jgi:hypothetical protein